jgi:NAD(P)-dependent dehydrogenase (short-subunit alcohol dehydrogenase family)
MENRLQGRVALVTGGSRGVGAAIARRLGSEGAAVAVNYRSDGAAANGVVKEITDAGGRAAAYAASIEDPDAVAAMVDEVRRDLGPVDLVVSNAGMASRGLSIADSDPGEFERLLRVHTLGPLQLIRELLPDLRGAPRGDVVVVSSVTVPQAPPNSAPYTMAKAAMEVAARTLAREERRHGLRVNIVAPGLVDTDMGRRLVRAIRSGEELESLHGEYPFGRVCQPEDVAGVVAFLVSADGSYVTGQHFVVDGGGTDPALA